jgi:ATP-dependent RNA helicase RhlB
MQFAELPLPESVRKGIAEAGFTECTPIQALTLPITLAGRDIAGQGQTGTGKTAAFLITLFNRLLENATDSPHPRALILAPTRELVVQIENDARLLGMHCGFSIQAVFGGVDYQKQREGLRQGVDVIIATPGRLIDYLKQKVFSLQAVEMLVIDEADRMFDLGFIADLRYIMRHLPPFEKRQNLMFSATLNARVMELAYEFMQSPEQVVVEGERITADAIEQVLYHVGRQEKFPLLLGLLRRDNMKRTIIFTNTKREAEHLYARLAANDFACRLISGDVPQEKRLRIMHQFKEGSLPILIATDVASRGLHIEGVSHVINYDLPEDREDYVHRIGRTARAGARGKAISFADEVGALNLEDIEDYIGDKIPVQWAEDDLFATDYVQPPRPRKTGRTDGRGKPDGRGRSEGRSKSGSSSRPRRRRRTTTA